MTGETIKSDSLPSDAGAAATSDEALVAGDVMCRQGRQAPPNTHSPDADSTTIVAAPWVRETLPSLQAIEGLPDNWDTYGSPPPSNELTTKVLRLLHWTEVVDLPVPAVVPVSGGGVQLEWYLGARELEVEFQETGPARFLAFDVDKQARYEGTFYLGDYNTMRMLLAWLRAA
jgi:hypothetical protein